MPQNKLNAAFMSYEPKYEVQRTNNFRFIISLSEFTNNSGFLVLNLDYSPIKGPKGNIEYLMHIRKDAEGDFDESIIENIVNLAHSELDKKEEA